MALIFALVVIVVALARLRRTDRSGLCRLHPGHVHVPALIAGSNPIMVGLIGSAAIMFVALYAAHGFSARTTTALGEPLRTDLDSATRLCHDQVAHLSGVAAEDDYVLAAAAPDSGSRPW